MYSFLFCLLFSISAFAEVGKFIKIEGAQDAVISRLKNKIKPELNGDIEEGDEIETNNSFLVLYLYPSTQIRLNKNSKIQITQALIEDSKVGEDNTSVIKLIKGIIRLQISKDVNQNINQQVTVGDVSFGVRGTEFEVSALSEDVDLDVFEGEVTVTSPHVQTFVPEVVKANEGFRYGGKKREFIRRKLRGDLKADSGFMPKDVLRNKWKSLKDQRNLRKKSRVETRLEKRSERRKNRKNR